MLSNNAKQVIEITKMNIENISFTLESYGQEFIFSDSKGESRFATLQLPTLTESINSIDGEEWDSDDEEKEAIFMQLSDFFYSQFKTKRHAKASILTGFSVEVIIEIGGFYAAIGDDECVILKEGSLCNYYNTFYFERLHFDDISKNELEALIELAKEQR
jgi:hypothetical protein